MRSRDIFDELSGLRDEIESKMKVVIDRRGYVAPPLREMVYHHLGWKPQDDVPIQTQGKRVRPLITLLVGKALGGNDEAVLALAAAIELIHNFTIVHDDIMDRSPERRHRPTLWRLWGDGQAINTGDGLCILGYLSALDLRHIALGSDGKVLSEASLALTEACLDTVEGQILDVGFEVRSSISVEEYIVMVSHKSASLIGCAARCGALLSTNDKDIVEAYAQFGRNLGIAFQMRDDYLGIWGDESVTGKPTGIDIMERKKSLPVVWGFAAAGDADRARLESIYANQETTEEDVNEVQHLLTDIGADVYTNQLASQYYEDSLADLAATGIENEWQEKLRSLAVFLIERTY